MKLYEFNIVSEAPNNKELQAKYAALLKTLKPKAADEGWWDKGNRQRENSDVLAKFAADNDLPGMYNPETGDFEYNDTDENGEPITSTAANGSMEDAKKLAGLGLVPPIKLQQFTDQLSDTTDILGGEREEYAKDMQDIFKANAASKTPEVKAAAAAWKDPNEAEPKKAEPKKAENGKNPLATKKGDYTGADGVEDMSTGMFVKPTPKADIPVIGADSDPADDPMIKAALAKEKAAGKTPTGKVKAAAYNTRDYDKTLAMQKELIKRGAKIDADGLMGPATKAAMKKFSTAPATPAPNPDPAVAAGQASRITKGKKPPVKSGDWLDDDQFLGLNWRGDVWDQLGLGTSKPLDKPAATNKTKPKSNPAVPAGPAATNKTIPKIDEPAIPAGPAATPPGKPKNKAIPKLGLNMTQPRQTQMASKKFTKPKLESRDGMRSLRDCTEVSTAKKTAMLEKVIESFVHGKIPKEVAVVALQESKCMHLLTDAGIKKRLYKKV